MSHRCEDTKCVCHRWRLTALHSHLDVGAGGLAHVVCLPAEVAQHGEAERLRRGAGPVGGNMPSTSRLRRRGIRGFSGTRCSLGHGVQWDTVFTGTRCSLGHGVHWDTVN